MLSPLLLLGLGCIFLGWNMPNHYPPYMSFHGELMPGVGMVLLWLGLVAARRSGRGALPLPKAACVWAAVGCIPLLQYASGMLMFRTDAALGVLYGAGMAASLYVGHLWSARVGVERVLRAVFLTVAVGAVAANVLALVQWLRLPVSGWWMMDRMGERPFGNLGQPNHFALMMLFGTIAVTALFEMRALRSPWIFAPLVAYMGLGVLISQSRAGALALMCVIACWLLTRRRVETRLRVPMVLVAAAIWLLLFVLLQRLQDILGLDAAVRETMTTGVRPVMWHHFWTAILAHPWLGYGFNQGVAAMAEVAAQWPPSPTHSTVYAHNFVLDLMVWGGIPLAVVLTGSLAFWLLAWLGRTGDGRLDRLRHLVFAIWLALVAQSLFEYPYAYAYFLIPAVLLAGAITLPPAGTGTSSTGCGYVAGKRALLLALVPAVLLATVVWDYSTLENDTRIARFARANYLDMPHHDFLDAPLVLDLLATMNKTTLFKLKAGMTQEQLEQLRKVARRVQNAAVQVDYAKALALNGHMDGALHELDNLRGLYDPEQYESIEKEWRDWLGEKDAKVPKL